MPASASVNSLDSVVDAPPRSGREPAGHDAGSNRLDAVGADSGGTLDVPLRRLQSRERAHHDERCGCAPMVRREPESDHAAQRQAAERHGRRGRACRAARSRPSPAPRRCTDLVAPANRRDRDGRTGAASSRSPSECWLSHIARDGAERAAHHQHRLVTIADPASTRASTLMRAHRCRDARACARAISSSIDPR